MSGEVQEVPLNALRKLLGGKRLRAYLLGNVIVLASSLNDVRKSLYAVSEPPSIPLEVLRREVWSREPAIAVTERFGEKVIVISDIESGDLALILGSMVASLLSNLSPMYVKRVDVVITYRASEDGGFTTRHEVLVYLSKLIRDHEVTNIVKMIEERIRGIFSRK